MRTSRPLRSVILGASILIAGSAWAQPRASQCFYSADFETIDQFSGWDIGPLVETQTPEGTGLGEIVPAWTVGDAQAADAGGYFPAPDQPVGNDFVMANDAAPPCNCAMTAVALTTPAFDLTDRSAVSLECRVFNEGTLGAGTATVEANISGDIWIALATIPTLAGEWQHLSINLAAFDGQPAVRIRFNWSDGGGWSSGFAMDDFCLRERNTNDLSLVQVRAHDATVSPFTTGDQSLRYRQIPLEQAGAITVTATVKNSGTAILRDIDVSASLSQNGNDLGPFNATMIDSLLPGEQVAVVIPTGWIPDALGLVEVSAEGSAAAPDDDVADNSANTSVQITGEGWANGSSTMSCDGGVTQGAVGGIDGFIAANRMEIMAPGSHAWGISALLGTASQVGEDVRAVLMDANFAFIDTSARRTLTQADIDLIWNGAPLYLPLSTIPELEPGDHFVGLQHLDTGVENPVVVNVSGDAAFGSSVLMVGSSFNVDYLRSTPMVRLHLSEVGVGLAELPANGIQRVLVHPTPASVEARLTFDLPATARVAAQIVDAAGRAVRAWSLGQLSNGPRTITIPLEDLSPGAYTVVLSTSTQRMFGRMQVAR